MELRFIERTEREPLNGNIYRKKTVRILQYRTQEAPWWQDVPLWEETGTEPTSEAAA